MATFFTPDLNELFEEAFERATGGVRELRTGYDFRTLRRSLNLMVVDWANRGVNLWALESGTIPLVVGQSSYDLPTDTVDVIESVYRTGSGVNQVDRPLVRISVSDYATLPNKNIAGVPNQVFVQRLHPTPKVNLWPVPSQTGTYYYWRLRRLVDGGTGNTTPDIPFRFLNAFVAGLAYYLAQKLPEGLPLVETLKARYDEAWVLASDEDRDRATLRIVPG